MFKNQLLLACIAYILFFPVAANAQFVDEFDDGLIPASYDDQCSSQIVETGGVLEVPGPVPLSTPVCTPFGLFKSAIIELEGLAPIASNIQVEFEVPVTHVPDTNGDLVGIGLNFPSTGLDVDPGLGMNFFLQGEADGLHARLFAPESIGPGQSQDIEDVLIASLSGATRVQMRLSVGAAVAGVALPKGWFRLCGAMDCQDDLTPPFTKIPRLAGANANGTLMVGSGPRLSLQGRVPGLSGVSGDALTLGFERIAVPEPASSAVAAVSLLCVAALSEWRASRVPRSESGRQRMRAA